MAHKIMKHNHNSNNRASSAFNPERKAPCDTRRKQKGTQKYATYNGKCQQHERWGKSGNPGGKTKGKPAKARQN